MVLTPERSQPEIPHFYSSFKRLRFLPFRAYFVRPTEYVPIKIPILILNNSCQGIYSEENSVINCIKKKKKTFLLNKDKRTGEEAKSGNLEAGWKRLSTASDHLRKGGTTRVEFDSGWWLGGIQYNRAIKFTYNLYPSSSSPPFESGASLPPPSIRFSLVPRKREHEGARPSKHRRKYSRLSTHTRPLLLLPSPLFLLRLLFLVRGKNFHPRSGHRL